MARKRKNGQGTVRLRSDGRWEGRHIVGYDENGKAKQKSVLAKTKAECVEKLKKLQEEYTEVAPFKVKPDMRFGDWMNYWYENHCKPSIRPTTQKGYEEWIYVHAIPGLGHIPLNKLTQADCQKFLNEMKANGRKTHRDTKGPEIRTRDFAGGKAQLKNGEMFTLTTRDILGDAHGCGITYANLPQELKAGDAVLIDDGKLRLEVCETTEISSAKSSRAGRSAITRESMSLAWHCRWNTSASRTSVIFCSALRRMWTLSRLPSCERLMMCGPCVNS